MKKILIEFKETAFEACCIGENVRAYNYPFNKPVFDGYTWGIVTDEVKSIPYAVDILSKEIIISEKRKIEESVDCIANAKAEKYYLIPDEAEVEDA